MIEFQTEDKKTDNKKNPEKENKKLDNRIEINVLSKQIENEEGKIFKKGKHKVILSVFWKRRVLDGSIEITTT